MTADLEVPYGSGSDAWRDWAENLVACRALGLHCRSVASGEVEMVMDETLYDLNPNGASTAVWSRTRRTRSWASR